MPDGKDLADGEEGASAAGEVGARRLTIFIKLGWPNTPAEGHGGWPDLSQFFPARGEADRGDDEVRSSNVLCCQGC